MKKPVISPQGNNCYDSIGSLEKISYLTIIVMIVKSQLKKTVISPSGNNCYGSREELENKFLILPRGNNCYDSIESLEKNSYLTIG